MPRIRRWFNVSHDINSDEEVWELTDKWDSWGLRVWLQMLSIADRNDGIVKGDIEQNERWMSRLFSSNSRRYSTKWRHEMCHSMLEWMQNKRWIEIRSDAIVIVNWLIYNPTRETKGTVKESPPTSPPNHPTNKEYKRPHSAALVLPDWMPKKEWEEWLAFRKRKKAPVTDSIAKRIIEKIAKLNESGISPEQVLTTAIDRNWTGIEIDWFKEGKRQIQGEFLG